MQAGIVTRNIRIAISFAFLLGLSPAHAASPKFNFDNIWRVEVGMTKAQVEGILGKPNQVVKRGPGGTGDESWVWFEQGRSSPKELLKNRTAVVVFTADKASGVPHRSRTIPQPMDEWPAKAESAPREAQTKDAQPVDPAMAQQSDRAVEAVTGSGKEDSLSPPQVPAQTGRSSAGGGNLPKFALKNVAKVQIGMAKAQVEQILGKPTQVVRRGPGVGEEEAWFWSVSNVFRTKGAAILFTGDKVSEIPPQGQILSPEEFVKRGEQGASRLEAERAAPSRPEQDLRQLQPGLEKLQATLSEIRKESERQAAQAKDLMKLNQELAVAKLEMEKALAEAEQKLAKMKTERPEVIPGQIALPDRSPKSGSILSYIGPGSLRNGLVTLVAVILILAFVGAAVGFLLGRVKGRPGAGTLWGLLGPIGWLVVAQGSDLRPKCASCGGVVIAGAAKCLHCGSNLSSESTE